MGLDAEVLAIGPFTRALEDLLEYPAQFYSSTREGATVITLMLTCVTSQQSHELAAAFGTDAFDFNRHHLDPQAADIERLRQNFEEKEVERFLRLRDAGFTFYYRPNG